MKTRDDRLGYLLSNKFVYILFIIISSSQWLPAVHSFTLQKIPRPLKNPQPGKGYFGYTLTFHGPDENLLIGAPLSNSSDTSVVNPGAVYKCPGAVSGESSRCFPLDVDSLPSAQETDFTEMKDGQRLGAAMVADGDKLLVCAPNWHYEKMHKYNKKLMGVSGKCFYSNSPDLDTFRPFSPSYDKGGSEYYFEEGYCQAGFSAAFPAKEDEVLLGAPGCWAWMGDVFVSTPGSTEPASFGKNNNKAADFGINSNQPLLPYDRYLGYSVATGVFGGRYAVVASSPRVTNVEPINTVLNSSVTIFHRTSAKNLAIWKMLYPPENTKWQFSYCGASIAVADVNNDGLDDVVVGCPSHDGDRGAVLVYTQSPEGQMTLDNEVLGNEENDRFGSSVMVLKDIDGDNYNEIAVGAPYTHGGVGSAYIFCTYRGPFPEEPCQTLDLYEPDLRSFGWSFASASGVVAVSAPMVDVVFVYSTLPVVDMTVQVSVDQELDIGTACTYPSPDADQLPCVDIEICVSYNIRNGEVPDRQRAITVVTELDIGMKIPRIVFGTGKNYVITSYDTQPDDLDCKKQRVYYKNTDEKFAEFNITATATFEPESEDKVVLDSRTGMSSSAMLRMKVECPGDSVDTCRSDIVTTVTQIGQYIYGNSTNVTLKVSIVNIGDSAFYPKLQLRSEGDLEVTGTISIEGAVGVSKCTPTGDTSDVIVCPLGGVIYRHNVQVSIFLSPTKSFIDNIELTPARFTVTAETVTQSTVVNPNTAKTTKNIDIAINPDLQWGVRKSSPEQLQLEKYSSSDDATKIGPWLNHTYQLYNYRKYPMYGVIIDIYWPLKLEEGDFLLDVFQAPLIVVGEQITGHCEAFAGGAFDDRNLLASSDVLEKESNAYPVDESIDLGSRVSAMIIRCALGDLNADQTVDVTVFSRADYSTFETLSDPEVRINPIKSVAVVSVRHAPFNTQYNTDHLNTDIKTTVLYPEEGVPWWVIVLSVMGGLAIVFILVVIACVCRKKKRAANAADNLDKTGDEQEGKEEGEREEEGKLMGQAKGGPDGADDNNPTTATSML